MEMLLRELSLDSFEADGTTPVANPYGEGQATATSDANGLVTFTGFEAKDYVVKELTAPEGYQLSTDVIKVSASELKAATNPRRRQRNSGQQTIHFNSTNSSDC